MRRRSTFHLAHVLASCAALAGVSRAMGQEADQPPAAAQRPAAAPARQADPAAEGQGSTQVTMDWLLKQWEKQSSLLKTLDVELFRTDETPAWGETEYYKGRALFKSPNLAFIDFNKVKTDGDKRPIKDAKGEWDAVQDERIICTGNEVWQFKIDTKQLFIYKLQKDAQQKAIEEGPLPFLFNMRADDARKRYKMAYLKKDPKANAYVVKIEPRLEQDMETFKTAFVSLDSKFLLPVRILMISPDGKSTKDYRLFKMKPNGKVVENNFRPTEPNKGWKIIRDPMGQENQPAAGGFRPRRQAAAARPAAPDRGADEVERK